MVPDDVIDFFYEEVDFQLDNSEKVSEWLALVAKSEDYSIGDLNYIFCDDTFLLDINQKFLEHDYFTDVITFDYSEGSDVIGEIYISIDRVKDNALEYGISFMEELHRVMVHGLLHMMGYRDKEEDEVKLMREKENFYLKLGVSQ